MLPAALFVPLKKKLFTLSFDSTSQTWELPMLVYRHQLPMQGGSLVPHLPSGSCACITSGFLVHRKSPCAIQFSLVASQV